MKRIRELVVRAAKDFELARKYARLKEYATASILYNKAIEKVLKALFISRTRKEPPTNVSMEYLARRARMPTEISEQLLELQDEESEIVELEDMVEEHPVERKRVRLYRLLQRTALAKTLLDYGMAYAKA